MNRSWMLALVATAVLVHAAPAHAQQESVYAARAVQNRLYTMDHELTLHLGVLPLDAFTKGLTVSGSYTLHLSDLLAWEVVHALHSFHVDTALKDDLGAFDLTPTPFEVLDNLVTSNVVFKPLYWKGAWLNDSLLYGEILMVVGGGYGWFTRSNRVAVDFGLGLRLYTSELLSFRLDARHLAFFEDSILNGLSLHHEVWVALGASMSL